MKNGKTSLFQKAGEDAIAHSRGSHFAALRTLFQTAGEDAIAHSRGSPFCSLLGPVQVLEGSHLSIYKGYAVIKSVVASKHISEEEVLWLYESQVYSKQRCLKNCFANKSGKVDQKTSFHMFTLQQWPFVMY